MKVVVINGTQQKGCTYNFEEFFLDELKVDENQENLVIQQNYILNFVKYYNQVYLKKHLKMKI
ncbi:MAG: hypothetical protein ACOX02_04260 [Acholeplasmatales bacterium]